MDLKLSIWRGLVKLNAVFCVLCLVLASCGGGSSTGSSGTVSGGSAVTQTGVFSDAPVSGLTYTTSSGLSGTTNALGQFSYASGDTVTFKAAGITLGSAQPTALPNSIAVVTPVNLVTGATGVTDPTVTAIGQLLSALNSISVSLNLNQNSSTVFTVPTGTGVAAFISALQGLGTSASQLATALGNGTVQTAINTALGANKGTVPTAANAQANMNQGANGNGFVGSVWTSCACVNGQDKGTFYFQPDGLIAGYTTTGSILSGSWSGSSTASLGVQFSLLSSGGGYTGVTTLANGATTGSITIYNSGGTSQGSYSINQVSAATGLIPNSSYSGGWYGSFTPNSAGTSLGMSGGGGYFILAADGSMSGIAGSNHALSGTWNTATGLGSGSFTTGNGSVTTITIDVSNLSGVATVGGTNVGSIVYSRTGSIGKVNSNQAGASNPPIPLLLNVVVNWPANVGNVVSSFALGLTVKDTGGNPVGNDVKSEINTLGIGAIANSTTDNIAASYPTGMGATYSLSVGPSNCTIANGSGTVNDANSGNAGAYPTVTITCH